MKIRELFEYVDEVMENVFSDKVKLRWLNQIEAELQVDVLLLAPEGITRYTEQDMDAELIAPSPYDELYAEYLQYRICLAQQEPERANNMAATFNRSYNEYVRHVAQTANPGDGMAEQMQYYLTAYQLAVKHGFSGSEEEWVHSLQGTKVRMEYDEQSKMLVIDYSEGNDGDQTGNETGTGTPGVGIASVIQTTTSTEDGGVNVITVTKTDGSTSDFQVRNGSQGGKGDIGVGISNIGLANGVLTFSLTDGSQKTVNMPETESCGDCYNKEEINAMFGSYIDDVAALVGGNA